MFFLSQHRERATLLSTTLEIQNGSFLPDVSLTGAIRPMAMQLRWRGTAALVILLKKLPVMAANGIDRRVAKPLDAGSIYRSNLLPMPARPPLIAMTPSKILSPSGTEPPQLQSYILRHSHDVRNCLMAMDLQTMLLQCSLHIPEDRLTTLRRLIASVEETQLRLGIRFRQPCPTAISLRSLFSECQSRQRMGSVDREIDWLVEGEDCLIRMDAVAVSVMVAEIADHFFSLGGGTITATADETGACIRMHRVGDDALSEPLAAVDEEAWAELMATAARQGGGLEFAAAGRELTLTFQLAPPGFHEPLKNHER